jgi:nicotinamidase-related amidase
MLDDRTGEDLVEPSRTIGNTALLLIDFQRDFCEVGGYADTIDDVGFAREVVPRAARLLDAARQQGLIVVHTREGYAPDCPIARFSGVYAAPAQARRSVRSGRWAGS